MKSTQPCQVHIPWVGEPSLRSFVQFSCYLFFNVISKKCPKLSVSSDWGTSCSQDSWECSPAFALVSLSQCTPPCWLPRTVSSHFCFPLAYLLRSQHFVTLCQHEKVHSTVAHTVCWGEPSWFLWYTWGFCHCGIIVSLLFIKSLSFVILIFGYILLEFFYLQHNNIITDIWLSLIISLVYFSSQFKTLILPKTNNIQPNY